MYDGEGLSRAIASIRERRGWTQQDLADWSGLNRTYVSTLESGDLAQQVERLLSVVSTLGYELRLVPRSPGTHGGRGQGAA